VHRSTPTDEWLIKWTLICERSTVYDAVNIPVTKLTPHEKVKCAEH